MASTDQRVDVVVVGAGLSGLRAAVELETAGLRYVVLEALDRVGGRTLTVPSYPARDNSFIELGAAWINDSNQSEMYSLAKEFGFKLIQQRAEGDSLYQTKSGNVSTIPYDHPCPLTEDQALEFQKFLEKFSEYVERSDLDQPYIGPDAKELDSMTAHDFANKNLGGGISTTLSTMLTRALLGVESHEVSALFLVDFVKSGTGLINIMGDLEHNGQYLRNSHGNGSFAVGLARKLKRDSLKLSSPVQSIVQTEDDCVTTTHSGVAYRSKKVIVSVPSNLYHRIQFTPNLPPSKLALSKSSMGFYSKTVFVFATSWWRDANLSGSFSSEDGPITFTRDTCVPDLGQFSITCFHVGEPGRRLAQLSSQDRRKVVWSQFRAAFQTVVQSVPQPINVVEKHWMEEPWVQGNPIPVMKPGLMTSKDGKRLWEPFHHVYFVGAETSRVWKGYMEGAVRSGARGAKDIIAQLAVLSQL
ncbi:amine oxidase [Aspergillus pseudoustus]|uniref:Amine oxidase n=1 Tax=Aspergillus pseudoustus TaxID=1810923 RepID=A0ABR4JGV5_9EURO